MAAVCIYDSMRPAHLLLGCEMGGSTFEACRLELGSLELEDRRQTRVLNVVQNGLCSATFVLFELLRLLFLSPFSEVQSCYILPFNVI